MGAMWQICPLFVSLGKVLFVAMYVFASIGMLLFGGLIQVDAYGELTNPHVRAAWSGGTHYRCNNFNDMFSSMVVLFELLIFNNWSMITDGFVQATGPWARC